MSTSQSEQAPRPSDAPASDLPLFNDETLRDPYPAYAQLRDLGPAVYLERYNVWALSHYDTVRAGMADYHTYSSAHGVQIGPAMPGGASEPDVNMLVSDPPTHTTLRRPVARQIGPRAIAGLRQQMADRADELVRSLVRRGQFDVVSDLADPFVTSLMFDLVGMPEQDREHLLEWAQEAFEVMGPQGERMERSLPTLEKLFTYMATNLVPGQLASDGWGAELYAAAERGEIPPSLNMPVGMVGSYVWAGMITTIHGISSLIWLLATHPEQWQRLCDDPSLVPAAIDEALRCESPIQGFGRRLLHEAYVGGTVLPEGSWVAMLWGAANRDERKWGPDGNQFDITRQAGDHLAFGHGPHTCVGQNLAKLKAETLIDAFVQQVEQVEVAAEPDRRLNNVLRGFGSLPIRVVPAAG